MSSKLNVWLVRHGESISNAGTWVSDAAIAPLTEKGEQQAKAVAAQIQERPDLLIVSPNLRAIKTAEPILKRWPDLSVETWPIQEIVYLSPFKYTENNIDERQHAIEFFWQQADPFYCDDGAESFSKFLERIRDFQRRLLEQRGFVVVVGHGQFFKAYLLGLQHGFEFTSAWMKNYREEEVNDPIANGEIVKIAWDPPVMVGNPIYSKPK